jgi:acyl-CoA dehydrogenase
VTNHLDWPFFEASHRALAREAQTWCESQLEPVYAIEGEDDRCRALVAAMGSAGFLRHAIVAKSGGVPDVRAACILRDVFAQRWGLADFAYAMQGLGCGPISLYGTNEQRERFTAFLVTHDVEEALYLAERVLVLSERPARVLTEIAVDLPYPRHRGTARFTALRQEVLGELGLRLNW